MKILSSQRRRNLYKYVFFKDVISPPMFYLFEFRAMPDTFRSIEQAVFLWRISPCYWPTREHPTLLRSYSRFPFKVFIGQSSAASVRCLNKGADIDSSPLIFGGYGSPIEFP